jgi:TonB family protein
MNHDLLQNNVPFLIAFVASSILSVAAGLIVQRLVRGAAARHAILLASLLLPPVLFAAGAIGLRLPLPAQPPAKATVVTTGVLVPAQPANENRLPVVLATIWIAGAMVSLARISAEASRWRGIAARAEIVSDPVILNRFESECVLARSAECVEPTVIGIVDPIVVLPAGYDLEPPELEAVFAHELAHVARRDNLTALMVQLVCAAFWFDPLHRIARRKLVELRERVCDDLVLDRGCDAEAYVAALARSCETSFNSTFNLPTVACMSRLKLNERMESIMTHETRRRWPAWITRGFVTATVAAAAITFATFAPAPAIVAGAAPGAYDFDVRIMPHDGGRFTLTIRVDTPEGPISSVAVISGVPDSRTVTTTHGDKTYKVALNVAADGSAVGTLDVSEGGAPVLSKTKTFPIPMPPAPPRPSEAAKSRWNENMKPPKIVSRVEPVYTAEAKANGIFGVVILALDITETGAVTDVQVVKPLPYGLDQAAVDAVRQWRWEPATLDGKAVPVKFNVTINFKLG